METDNSTPTIQYDHNCIQQIKDAFKDFVRIHGCAPKNVSVGPYEYQQIQKAREAGETMKVAIDGIEHRIAVRESTK